MYQTYDELIDLITGYLSRYDTELIGRISNFIGLAEVILARLPKTLGTKKVVVGNYTKDNPVLVKPNRWRSTIYINYGTGNAYKNTVARQSTSGARTLYFETPHDFYVDDVISVSGVGGSGYNGTAFTITSYTPLSITYTNGVASEAFTEDTGGYVTTAPNNVNKLLPRGYEFCRDYQPDSAESGLPLYYSNYDYNNFFIVPTPAQAFPVEIVYYEQPVRLSVSQQTNWFTQFAPDALLYGSLLQAAPYLKNDERIETWKNLYSAAINSIESEAFENLDDATDGRKAGK